MDLKIKDKLAFISGSTAGIGFAIAERLLKEGDGLLSMAEQKKALKKQ